MCRMKWRMRGRTSWRFLAAIAIVGGLLATGLAVSNLSAGNAAPATPWYADAPAASATPVSQASPTTAKDENPARYAKALSKAFHNAANTVLPAVVTITNMPKPIEPAEKPKAAPDNDSEEMPFGFQGTPFEDMFKRNPEMRRFFRQMPGGPMQRMPHRGVKSFGSGVIVDPSGVVLTNNHVVAGGGNIAVRLQDGREFKAIDIKTDPKTDLAVVRLEGAKNLPFAKLGDSGKVEIGDWVVALGQPFGLPGTVTAGIISAKGRGIGITAREDFLQTDAAINPGNSGGPLVNLDGEVIGINTAISSSSGGYQGVGFAIPANLAKWVGGQLVTAGAVRRAYLGVVIQPITPSLAEQFKAKISQGVLITDVRAGTPAAKAGVKSGDIVTEFAGKPVASPQQLQNLVEMAKPGSTQPLTIVRAGERMTLRIHCEEMPTDFGAAPSQEGQPSPKKSEPSRFEKLGIQVDELTAELAKQLNVKADHGVVITDVRAGSPADVGGLASGMVIVEANQRPVKTVEDLRKALAEKPIEKGVLLLVRLGEGSRYIVIQAAEK